MISYKPHENREDDHVIIPTTFPGISHYTRLKVLNYLPAVKMKGTNQIYVNGKWRYDPIVPIVIISVSVIFFVMCSIFLLPHFGTEGKVINVISFFLVVLLDANYLQSIIVGPGYFPFFWSEQTRTNHDMFNDLNDLDYHDDESPSGIITNSDQLNWARTKPRPKRSIVSSKAGRIVMRPDHFCDLISSWVGKKNLKFFILFIFYTFVVSILLIIYTTRFCLSQVRNNSWRWNFDFLFAFYALWCGVGFSSICLFILIFNCNNVRKGHTALEEKMKIDLKKLDNGCIKNFEDVFGPSHQCLCWLCPTDPWKSKSNDQIVENYDSYYDKAFFTN